MDKSVHISMLLDIYGKLLTDKQFDVINLYYNNNLSLGEIALELDITRQGVREIRLDAEKNLFDFEEKLMLLKKKVEFEKRLNKIIEEAKDENMKKKLNALMDLE